VSYSSTSLVGSYSHGEGIARYNSLHVPIGRELWLIHTLCLCGVWVEVEYSTVLAAKGGGSMGTVAAIAPKVLKRKGLAQK